MRLSAKTVAAMAVLVVVLGAAFHRLLESPGSLIVDGRRPTVDHATRGHARQVGNDLTSVFLPRFLYVVSQIRANGRPPYWDTLGFGGRPLVGNPQAGSYYPPIWLAWRIGRPSVLGWLTLAHLVLAGAGVYALARGLGLRRPSAVLAGACYELSPYLIAHTLEGHYPHVWAACWYPWAFWGLRLCLRKNPLGYWTLPGVLALTFLTGHPQEWYYLVVALTVWVAAEGGRRWRAEGVRAGLVPPGIWAAVFGLSLVLCAVDLVPQVRAGAWSLKAGAMPLNQINRYRLHSFNLTQLLSPLALGGPREYFGEDNYWETVFSIGLVPLVLAVIGGARHPDRRMVRPWLILALVAAVFAGGKALGLYALAYEVLPGMERFRVPARTLFLASLAASVLAGAGADWLLQRGFTDADWARVRARIRGVLVGVAAVVVVTAVVAGLRGEARRHGGVAWREFQALATVAAVPGFWLGVAGALGVIGFVRRSGRGQESAAWGLGAVGVLELALYAHALVVCTPVSAFVGNDPIGRAIRDAGGAGHGPVRITSFGAVYPDLNAAALGLEKTNVNDGFQIQHAADLYQRVYTLLDSARPLRPGDGPMDDVVEDHRGRVAQTVFDLMGVGYLVSDRPLPLPNFEPVVPEVTFGARGRLWRNRTALPLAYVVPRGVVPPPSGRASQLPRLGAFEPRDGVVMSRDPLDTEGPRQPFTPATWVSHDPDEVVVRVTTEAPGLLVVGNTWMPGWKATVDARPAAVERGNHWQQVVALPSPGRHEVVLKYRPPGLAVGLRLATAAVVTWAAFGVVLAVRALRTPRWQWRARPASSPFFRTCRSA